MRNLFLSALLLCSLLVIPLQPASAQDGAAAAVAPTEISAELGTCSALINVTGADSKPIFNAKIATRIRYGLMGVKKLDLETYTNAMDKPRSSSCRKFPKKAVFINISKDDKLETVEFEPDVHCTATFDVQLK